MIPPPPPATRAIPTRPQERPDSSGFARLAASNPDNVRFQRDLATSHDQVGAALVAEKELAAALAECRAAQQIREEIARREPDNLVAQRDVALSLRSVAAVLLEMDERDAAREHLAKSAAAFERVAVSPEDYYNAASTLALYGDADGAFAKLDEAVARGWRHTAWMEQDADLASLRSDPRWKALIARIRSER